MTSLAKTLTLAAILTLAGSYAHAFQPGYGYRYQPVNYQPATYQSYGYQQPYQRPYQQPYPYKYAYPAYQPYPAGYGYPQPRPQARVSTTPVTEPPVVEQVLTEPAPVVEIEVDEPVTEELPVFTETELQQEEQTQEAEKSPKDDKQAFIDKVLPFIAEENEAILKSRKWLKKIEKQYAAGTSISEQDLAQLKGMLERYQVEGDPADRAIRLKLLRRVDIIPTSLALAQAASESAWGKSRFAKEANNLFGIWTYDSSKGLKPKKRENGKKHFVRVFSNAGESVRYYMHLLNTHHAYKSMRTIRAELRAKKKPLEGTLLASGMLKYSARGEKYVKLLQSMIGKNEWVALDQEQV